MWIVPIFLYAQPKHGVVSEVTKNGVVASVDGALVGEMAIVLLDYGEGSIITHSCAVNRSNEHSADLICKRFDNFDQDSIPKVDIDPKVGDRVVVAPLSNYILIVAPSASRYVKSLSRQQDKIAIHPDLFALELRKEKNPHPKVADFQRFCKKELIGTVVFALDDGDYEVDCGTFMLIRSNQFVSGEEKDAMKPFFHRIHPVKKGFFAWAIKKEISNFDRHYRSLIKERFDAKRFTF